jgi:divalent metal cation (Fe/Co/Zn/Cd) transporter
MLPGHISLDGLHSLFDSTPNTIVLVGITISRPTDKEHPYGHASSRRLPL